MNDQEEKEKEIENAISNVKSGEADEEDLLDFIHNVQENYDVIKKNKGEIKLMLGFIVHPNIFIHFLITLIMNVLICFAIQGIFKLVIYDNLLTFLLGIVSFSIFEVLIKVIVMKWFMKIALASMGVIFSLVHFLGFLMIDMWYPNFEFKNTMSYFLFIILLNFLRIPLSKYIRMYSLSYYKRR